MGIRLEKTTKVIVPSELFWYHIAALVLAALVGGGSGWMIHSYWKFWETIEMFEHLIVMLAVAVFTLIPYAIFIFNHNAKQNALMKKEQNTRGQTLHNLHADLLKSGLLMSRLLLGEIAVKMGTVVHGLKHYFLAMKHLLVICILIFFMFVQLTLGVMYAFYFILRLKQIHYGWFLLGFLIYPALNFIGRMIGKVVEDASGLPIVCFYGRYGIILQAFAYRFIFFYMEIDPSFYWDEFVLYLLCKTAYKLIFNIAEGFILRFFMKQDKRQADQG